MGSQRNSKVRTLRVGLALLVVAFILSSCAMCRRRAPVGVERQPREKVISEAPAQERVSTRTRKKSAKKVKAEPVRVAKQHGEITSNSVNIRAGASINYEILAKMNEGDRVSILNSAFGWHEIQLPAECFGWIHSDYVVVMEPPAEGEKITGILRGNSVRIRARPGLNYSVLTKVNKGDKVIVVGLEGDWLKIELPQDCTGWVHSDYVKTD